MSILLVSPDLATGSQVLSAAKAAGVDLVVALSALAAVEKAQAHGPTTIIIDLSTPGLDPELLVAELRTLACQPRTIVAFAPHVHEQKVAAARAAGCDQVLTRGQFTHRVDELVAQDR